MLLLASWVGTGCYLYSAPISDPFPPLSAVFSTQEAEVYGLCHPAPRPSDFHWGSANRRWEDRGQGVYYQQLHTTYTHWDLNLSNGCSPL